VLSIDYEISVPAFKKNEIGLGTLVRAYPADLQIKLTNDGQTSLYKLNVRPVLESYVGQDKPMLFLWSDKQVIDELPPKSMVPLNFRIWASYPGLVAVAVYITDAASNVVQAKRQTEPAYKQEPVRWWFHVIDDISIETLRALRALAEREPKETKK
jgi:hypothetical protein